MRHAVEIFGHNTEAAHTLLRETSLCGLTGDVVELELPMPVRFMAAHPAIADARGKVAVMRGPMVYCLEGDDVPPDVAVEQIRVPAGAELTPVFTKEMGGVIKLTGTLVSTTSGPAAGDKQLDDEVETALYRDASFAGGSQVAKPSS